ncbi:MAG: hypothetical protein M3P18_02645 [Actinomycetota bacterium]|nr:hypothetical protein [Actinomycetota bacterium]
MADRWLRELERIEGIDPTPGLLDRAKGGPSPIPLSRSGVGRRVATAAVALVVGLAGVGVAFLAFTGGSTPAGPRTGSSYTDALGWTARVPPDWFVTRVDVQSLGSAQGAMFSNVSLPMPTGATSSNSREDGGYPPNIKTLPANAVILAVVRLQGGGYVPYGPHDDTRFPLSFRDFQATPGTNPFGPSVMDFYAGGIRYTAEAWVGPAAANPEIQTMRRTLASVRFPSVHTYGVTEPSRDFFVLDRPEAYPVDTVRFFQPSDFTEGVSWGRAPFALVHTKQGFYALGLEHVSHFSQLTYRPGPQMIVLNNAKGQVGHAWDLQGRTTFPIRSRSSAQRPKSLPAQRVIVSYDGHLLTSPLASAQSVVQALRN